MTTAAVLRKFRRRYLSARNVYRKLTDLGRVTLKVAGHRSNGRDFSIAVDNKVPDEALITRLTILTYPFLDPANNLYWHRILAIMDEAFESDIPPKLRERVDSCAYRLSRSSMIGIKFNDTSLDPQDLYLKVAKGFYFGRELQAESELNELLKAPLLGPILLNSFYNYTMTGFNLTSSLYDLFLEVSKSASFQKLHRDKETRTGRCIYCKSAERKFSSEEHIIAESLGNDELVLPAGFVCDRCNNELLAPLDDALSKFAPIALLRVFYVPYGKDGKLPNANFENMEIRKISPTQIEIRAKDKTGFLHPQEGLEDGDERFAFSTSVRTSNLDFIARAYFKIALGIVALDKGAEFALSERYESARAFIRGEKGFPTPLILRRSGRPHENLRVYWQKLDPGSLFFIDIFGVLVTFNLEVEPRMKSPQIFENLGCMVFDLNKLNEVTWLRG